jgi:AraC-like DNA-binding protein
VPELTDRIHDFFSFLSDQSPRDSVKKSTLILEFIEANYKDPALGAQLLCDRFRISPTYLSRLIKTETGQGLLDCIHAARVKNAKTLLANTNLSIEQVALQVGFSNRYGLIRAFRAIEGMTPSEYRSLIDAGH